MGGQEKEGGCGVCLLFLRMLGEDLLVALRTGQGLGYWPWGLPLDLSPSHLWDSRHPDCFCLGFFGFQCQTRT